MLGQARAAVAHAKQYCDDVEFSPEDGSRSDVEFMAEVVKAAIEEGATTINIPDTVGYTMPHEYAEIFDDLYRLVPELNDVVVPSIATTTLVWRSRTRSRACGRARDRSSAR